MNKLTQLIDRVRKLLFSNFGLRLVGTVLTIAAVGWLLYKQGWSTIVQSLQMIPPWQLGVALILTLLSRIAVGFRWYFLLRSSGENVTVQQALRLTFAGLFASNYLPTTVGGDVVRLAGAVQLKLDAARSAASLVLDRLVGMAGMAVMLPWGLVPFFHSGLHLFGKSGWMDRPAFPWSSYPGRAAFAGVAIRMEPLSRLLARLRALSVRLIGRFWEALVSGVHHPQALFLSFLCTLVYMACRFTTIWLFLQGMGQPMGWMQVAGVWSLVYFITLMPFSINGYGLQEFSVTLLYPQLGGITQGASLTIALLSRIFDMAASLPGALFVPGILAARHSATAVEAAPGPAVVPPLPKEEN